MKNRRYYFRAKTNLNSMKNFNLFVFIRYLRDIQNAFPIPEYLVTLQAGFRYTIGRGKFIINEFAFK